MAELVKDGYVESIEEVEVVLNQISGITCIDIQKESDETEDSFIKRDE